MAAEPGLAFDDENLPNNGGAGGAAVMTPPVAPEASESPAPPDAAAPPSAAIVPGGAECVPGTTPCANCEAPMDKGLSYCRRCGFYPALNTFVEVAGEQCDAEAGGEAQPAKSHWEVWKSLIPRWGWIILSGVAVLLVISLLARFVVPEGTPRATWTYAQLGLGIAVALGAHVACYMHAIMVNDSLSFVDIILKPFVIWTVTLHDLPSSLKRVALGGWGLSAALFAAFVVAGVRYDEIIDWGEVPVKKKKAAVIVPIDVPSEDKSMEEAIDEFTENAGVGPAGDDSLKQKGNRQKMAKCLIIGYTPNRESDFGSLVLAIEEGGKWRFAGLMNQGMSVEARSILNRRMRMHRRSTPAIPCDLKAFWLEPKIMCTVWYEDWTEDLRLKNPLFDKLQPDFRPVKAAPAGP